MTFGIYDPYREPRLFQAFTHFKIAKRLIESQEADVGLLANSFQDEATHIFVAIMDIRFGFPGEHEVEDFLRRIAMLIDHRATFEVHVGFRLVDSSSHNRRVNQQNYALGIRGRKQIQVHLHQIVNQWEIVFDLQDDLQALVGQNRRVAV